jgi:NAD(P)-dependent dehydrogenase (short-subunit alcohol dehydrogenase family)
VNDTARTGALADRTVLVTGGSRGIGLACAEAVARAGANVVIAARNVAELATAAQRLSGLSAAERVHAYSCDVSDASSVERLTATTVERFGGLDGVIHAAAVLGPIGSVIDTDPAEWLTAVRVNLFGTMLVARSCATVMRARGGGSIVLLSGGGATAPFPNYSAYACSKAGVVRLAETLAHELAPFGVQVNALAPGFVATRMHEATLLAGERAGVEYLQHTREQLASGGVPAALAAEAALFLLSDAAAGITGRLLAAAWDDWRGWPTRREQIAGSDLFTLRRIVPADRGANWQ